MFSFVFIGTAAIGVVVLGTLPNSHKKDAARPTPSATVEAPVKPFRTESNVIATSDWTRPVNLPTSYQAHNISKLRITASGQWTGDMGGKPVRWCGAGGNGATAQGAYPLTGVSEWCLLIRVQGGPDQGTKFFRTNEDYIDITPPCTVSFRINDVKLDDNAGFLTVAIAELM